MYKENEWGLEIVTRVEKPCTYMYVGIMIIPTKIYLQRSAKRQSTGLVNFVAAVAYHICLALPVAFTQPGGPTFLPEPEEAVSRQFHNLLWARTHQWRKFCMSLPQSSWTAFID